MADKNLDMYHRLNQLKATHNTVNFDEVNVCFSSTNHRKSVEFIPFDHFELISIGNAVQFTIKHFYYCLQDDNH